jgi:hypothetical protein
MREFIGKPPVQRDQGLPSLVRPTGKIVLTPTNPYQWHVQFLKLFPGRLLVRLPQSGFEAKGERPFSSGTVRSILGGGILRRFRLNR